MEIRFVNLTPHRIVLLDVDGDPITVEPSGQLARVSSTPGVELGSAGGVSVFGRPTWGAIEGLPDPQENVVYIVSGLVAQHTRRPDVVSPGTGPGDEPVRNEGGDIVAVTRLIAAGDFGAGAGPTLRTFEVERTGDAPLRFRGVKLATARSYGDRAMGSSWSGSAGRWEKLRLYRTAAGKYVCERQSHTQWQGERSSAEACVCSTVAGVVEFFEHGWLAAELFEAAGLDVAETVE